PAFSGASRQAGGIGIDAVDFGVGELGVGEAEFFLIEQGGGDELEDGRIDDRIVSAGAKGNQAPDFVRIERMSVVESPQDFLEGITGIVGQGQAAKASDGVPGAAKIDDVAARQVREWEAGDFLRVTIAAVFGDVAAREAKAVVHHLNVFADSLLIDAKFNA